MKIVHKILNLLLLIIISCNLFCENCKTVCEKTKGNALQAHKDKQNIVEDSDKVPEISAEALLKKINKPNILIVNVLGKRYYEDARIKGSISAPLRILVDVAKSWDKKKEIIVYCACRECDASAKACKMLKAMGFENVVAYEGGIREWYKKGYPCEGACKLDYLWGEGDSRKILAMRDCALRKVLLDVYWALEA
jgi:rhodanese-related sulfurtransferase